MAFWRAVNVARVCKHSPNPQGPLCWTPGGVLSFTQPAPSHTKLVSEGSHSCLKCSSGFAYFAHTILSFLTQSAICQYTLFILSDWQYELISPRRRGGGGEKRKRGIVAGGLFLTGTMAVCHSSFIIEIGVYLLQAWVECFCFSSDY